MQKFKDFWHKYDMSFWAGSVVFPLLSWLANRLVKLPHIRRSQMVLLSWLLINGCFAVWVGIHVKTNREPWWKLLIFPALYFVVAFFFMPPYSWYLALAYLALSYLAWALTKDPDDDEEQSIN